MTNRLFASLTPLQRYPQRVARGCAVVVALLCACSPAPPPPTTPTLQTAATQAVGTAQSAATAIAPSVSAGQTQVSATLGSAQTQVAPTITAAQTQMVSTVAAVQTQVPATVSVALTQAPTTVAVARAQVAPTVVIASATLGPVATAVTLAHQVAATAIAPTANAVATQVAPTVQAVATSGTLATSVAQSPVQVTSVSVAGQDTMIALQNRGQSAVNLTGWTLLIGPAFSVGLMDISVGPGQTMTLHFGPGVDSATDTYLGLGSGVASSAIDPGTRVVLVAPANQIASVYTIS